MDSRVLKKIIRKFNRYRFPECRAKTLKNADDFLIVEFNGTQGAVSCCFDENFLDLVYYIKDETGEWYEISTVEEKERGKFKVSYKKKA